MMRNFTVSPLTFNQSFSSSSLLSDEQVAVIASAADCMAKTLPPYAPKPLNMKKQIDKEIQVGLLPSIWRDGVVVRTSDLQPRGRRFESRPLRFTYNSGQVVHTHAPLFTKQYKLVPAQAGS